MSEPRNRPQQEPDLGIPDLVVPPPRPSQSRLRAVDPKEEVAESGSPLRSAARAPSPFGTELELEPEDLVSPKLELQMDHPISGSEILAHYDRAAAFSADDFEGALPGTERAVPAPVALGAVWPDGKTPDRERLLLDLNEVQRCASYGEAPSSLLVTPFYAVRVWFRRRALVSALGGANEELARAENDRDGQLSDMVNRLRPSLEEHPGFAQRPSLANATPPDVARAILAARGEIDVDAATLTSLRAADERVRSALKTSELHLRALDACDETKLQQGRVLLALAALAAVAAFILFWS